VAGSYAAAAVVVNGDFYIFCLCFYLREERLDPFVYINMYMYMCVRMFIQERFVVRSF